MATYHLRVKNDTHPSGKKISAKRHADYILREDGKSMRIISIEKEHRATALIVSLKEVTYPNGRKARLKNFSLRRPATRTKEIAGTRKLNCLYLTN